MTNSDHDNEGTALPIGDTTEQVAAAILNGKVARATHDALLDEGELNESAVEAIRRQTERLIERVVSAYEVNVAKGEVGEGGTAVASGEPPLHLRGVEADADFGAPVPGATGLLYGRIQSGKTAGMISFVAYAIDNGFRTIIVLTSDNVALVDQTAERFTAVQGPRVVSSTTAERWNDDIPNMRRNLPTRGLVVICSKNSTRLASLRELLQAVGAPAHPTLILDDEADQASLDANTRKRLRATTPAAIDPTKVSEEIQKIRTTAPHNVFLQVTATPFAMFLQNVDSPFRPSFTFLLEPGAGYTGGERFFSEDIFDLESDRGASPPLYLLDDKEPQLLRDDPETLPIGLKRALVFFLVAASARAVMKPSAYGKGQNFLCHESHRVADHKAVANVVRLFLDQFAVDLANGVAIALQLVEWAYAELQRTADLIPDLDAIVRDIDDRLPNREVIVVNAEGDTLKPRQRVPNFIIGGNIVGRGLTIPNLLVTYYGRNPQISQMDTMLQHARMFGYREPLMPFTRVFLPPSLAARFQGIHIAERELRQALESAPEGEYIPVRVVGKLRPTRHGVLDPGRVVTIRSGHHLYPFEPDLAMSKAREREVLRILATAGIPDEWSTRNTRSGTLTIEQFMTLIQTFKVAEWDAAALETIVRSVCGDRQPLVATRGMERKNAVVTALPTGALSGPGLQKARDEEVATFFVFRQLQARPIFQDRKFLYPTIVFPSRMPNHVYNDLEET